MLSLRILSAFKSTLSLFPRGVPQGNYLQSRYFAARKGKRAKLLAEKLQRKLVEASKPKPPPTNILRKSSANLEKARRRITDENYADSPPIDDIWRTSLYRGKTYTLEEALTMSREVFISSILNQPDAFVYATVEFDLHTKKNNHYLAEFSGVLTYPYTFQSGLGNKVIAICKSAEDQAAAVDAGAMYAGGNTLVKQILSGQIARDAFDYVLCHPDSYKDIVPLRGLLKKNYPNQHNGLLRLDLAKAIPSFIKGIKYVMEASTVEPDFGWVNVTFGRLNMNMKDLEENFKHLLNSLEKNKPQGVSNLFITRSEMWCANSVEHFKLHFEHYLPGYLEEQEDDIDAEKQ